MKTRPSWLTRLVLPALALCIPALAGAQSYVYPERGQSPQQQQADRSQCHGWAVQQTGFDPASARAAPAPPPPSQEVVGSGAMARGALGGGALGAVGGAIGGDAGKGAAIGAASGALIGGIRRHRQIEQEQQMYQSQVAQQQGTLAQGQANYERAFGACMAGRGYTVR